jgi:hypothetical protein
VAHATGTNCDRCCDKDKGKDKEMETEMENSKNAATGMPRTGVILRTPGGSWVRFSDWGFTAGVREVSLEDATLFEGPTDPVLLRAERMWGMYGPCERVRAERCETTRLLPEEAK